MESGIFLLRPEKSEAQPPILTYLQSKHLLKEKALRGKMVGSLFIIRDRDRRQFNTFPLIRSVSFDLGVAEGRIRIADVFTSDYLGPAAAASSFSVSRHRNPPVDLI